MKNVGRISRNTEAAQMARATSSSIGASMVGLALFSALAFATGSALHTLQQGLLKQETLSLPSPASFGWLRYAPLQFDTQNFENDSLQIAQPLEVKLTPVKVQNRRRARGLAQPGAHYSVQNNSAQHKISAANASVTASVSDAMIQAAIQAAAVSQAPSPSNAKNDSNAELARTADLPKVNEHQTLRSLYGSLRQNFLVAVNTQTLPASNLAQVEAASVSTQSSSAPVERAPEQIIAQQPDPTPKKIAKRATRKAFANQVAKKNNGQVNDQVAKTSAEPISLKVDRIAVTGLNPSAASTGALVKPLSTQGVLAAAISPENYSGNYKAEIESHPAEPSQMGALTKTGYPLQLSNSTEVAKGYSPDYKVYNDDTEGNAGRNSNGHLALNSETSAFAAALSSLKGSGSDMSTQKIEYSAAAATGGEGLFQAALLAQANSESATSDTASAQVLAAQANNAAGQFSQTVAESSTQGQSQTSGKTSSSQSQTQGFAASSPQAQSPYVEAFAWSTEIPASTVIVENLSRGSWSEFTSPGHLTTVAVQTPGQSIPLVDPSAAALLAKVSGTSLRGAAGFVFGKLAPGWTDLHLSERAESILYFNENMTPIAANAVSTGVRYFVFFNAAPGTQFIFLKNAAEGLATSVPVPVQSGKATYLDFTQMRLISVSGRIVDAGKANARGLGGVQIQWADGGVAAAKSSGWDTSDRAGKFKISNIPSFGNYPLYLDAVSKDGYKHRYSVLPSESTDIDLFRFSTEQIQDWIGQVAGGISPESGIAVAAILGNPFGNNHGALNASVQAFEANSPLVPDLHSLSPGGLLMGNVPLDNELPRFLGLQLTPGFQKAQITDSASGGVIWRHLFPASPGVINVIVIK